MFIRHPKSWYNEKHRIAWSKDVWLCDFWSYSLTKMSEYVRWKFSGSKIYSWTLLRCRELVDIFVNNNENITVYYDSQLNERNFGIYANHSKKEIITLLQKKFPRDIAGNNFSAWMDKEWLGFESNRKLQQRIRSVLEPIIEQEEKFDHTIIIPIHTWTGRMILSKIMNILPKDLDMILWSHKLYNLWISEFEYKEGIWTRDHTKINYIPDELIKLFTIEEQKELYT